MKKNKVTLFFLLFTTFAIISIKPLLFTSNFLLYMINKDQKVNSVSKEYLIRSLRLNPVLYSSLLLKERAEMLLLTAIVTEKKELLKLLKKGEKERIEKQFGKNPYYRNLYGNPGNECVFGSDEEVTNYLLSNEAYNYITISIIKKLDKSSCRDLFVGLSTEKRIAFNIELKKFIKEYFSE